MRGLSTPLAAFRPGADISLAVGISLLVVVLVVPLPAVLLDVGLAVSFTLSVLVLMVALFMHRPLDFNAFPTVLLLTTLLRLALNVATTRAILTSGHEGPQAAGNVISAFGGFLMGGDVLVGLIIFVILLVVNFVVVTKGSGRIAEVAARFSLDAMPGKQMAIDAELSSGLITEAEARRRRKELEDESAFFGAMDGAAKFVRGDAVAGLITTLINLLAGIAIGVGRHGMPFGEAVATFSVLTVGDGLVSQIPALLVSVAAGIVVTKGAPRARPTRRCSASWAAGRSRLAWPLGRPASWRCCRACPSCPSSRCPLPPRAGAYLRLRQESAAAAAPPTAAATGRGTGSGQPADRFAAGGTWLRGCWCWLPGRRRG